MSAAVFPQGWSYTMPGIESKRRYCMRRGVALVALSAILMAGTAPAAAAAGDAPERCGRVVSASPTGSWIAGTIASAADVDWYRFSLPGHRSVQYLLGGLPADYRM